MSSLVRFQIKTRVHTKSGNVFFMKLHLFWREIYFFFIQVEIEIKLKDKIATFIYFYARTLFLYVFLKRHIFMHMFSILFCLHFHVNISTILS